MTVVIEGETIRLRGNCLVEDAEDLLVALQSGLSRRVDLSQATRIHMAVAQILAIAAPQIEEAVSDGFLRGLLLPALLERNQR